MEGTKGIVKSTQKKLIDKQERVAVKGINFIAIGNISISQER